ncbi:MAG: hypothetical protein RSC06_03265 [Clostridia bacterium]
MLHSALACCRHSLRRVATMPRAWAVVLLMFLYLESQFSPIRQMLVEHNLLMSLPGLAMYLLSDANVSVMLGLGLLMLLFDAPFTDETQRYIVARAGRGAWALGQVWYVLVMVLVYLLAFLLLLLALSFRWLDWSGGWSSGLEALVRGGAYEWYNTMLDYDAWLMNFYTPLGGMSLALGLHALGFSLLALIQYAVNASGFARLGFFVAGAPLLFDGLIEEFFYENAYYFSPMTLTRLTTLDYGDQMGRPPVWYALTVLFLACAALALACVYVSRKREIKR